MTGESLAVSNNKDSELREIIINRQAQEVQAAMILAKKFPRDENDSFNKIRKSCQRKTLAAQAEYSYPKGGQKVTGPSIRLAEAVAQGWGNIDYGIIELSKNSKRSEMMAYAWDLETNTRSTKIFSVDHIREKTSGNVELKGSRDVYELTANMGARRQRACILAVIPGDVVEEALNQCRETLSGSYTEPLSARSKTMMAKFDDDFQVTKEMIETYFGYNLEALTEIDYSKLISIYNSIKDGMSSRGDHFKIKVVHTSKSSLDKPEVKE